MIIQSIDQMIGQTPLFSFKYNTNEIYVKLEKYNPAGSIKDRAVLYMLKDALNKGIINKDTVLIEATSGNTGIALAMLAQAYKIPLEIVMPASMSLERRQLIKAYGAKLTLTDASKGMQGSMDYMNQKLAENKQYVSLQQFSNKANAYAHYNSTAQEILDKLTPDIFISAIGTGGTITGIAKKLKEQGYTIIYITNAIDEILLADRIIVIKEGQLQKKFYKKDILENIETLKEINTELPVIVQIKERFNEKNINLQLQEFTIDELTEQISNNWIK